jgi:hypothetical protein
LLGITKDFTGIFNFAQPCIYSLKALKQKPDGL